MKPETARLPRCVFLVAVIAALLPSASAQELPFKHYTSDDPIAPLPANGVTSIFQDGVGFVWFALSGAGLVRYDGRVMEPFGTDDGIADRNVDGIFQDTLGRLWVTTYGGLSVTERPLRTYATGERPRFTSEYCGVELIDQWIAGATVVADPRGAMWVGTDGRGVLRYECEDGSAAVDTFRTGPAGANESVYALAVGTDGTVWASLSGGRLLALRDAESAEAAFETAYEDILGATATDLYVARDGTLWGGTYDGQLWRLDEDGWEDVGVELAHWIRGIVSDGDGTMWIGSSGGGLLGIGSEGVRQIGRREGLLSETVYGLGMDREGNLYVGQSQGVSKLPADYRAFTYFTATSHTGEAPVLPASSVTAVLMEDDRLWIATPGGLASVQSDGAERIITVDDGLPTNELYALGHGAEDVLWVGLNGPTTALHRRDTTPSTVGQTQTSSFSIGTESWQATSFRLFNVYSIRDLHLPASPSDTNRVATRWFTSYMKVACLIDGAWYTFRQDAGYPPTSSGAVAADDEGFVWIATDDAGLHRSRRPLYADSIHALHAAAPGQRDSGREIAAHVFEPAWTTSLDAPTNNIQNLIFHRGKLWIGTPEGLYFMSEPGKASLVDGLSDGSIVSLAAAGGSVWAGTNSGLAEIDADAAAVIRILDHADGLLNDETSFINSVRVAGDGAVLFGSAKGLTVYRPDLDGRNETPPPLVLRRAEFEVQSWGRNRYVAEYAALSFDREHSVRYRTRLRPYDDEWSDETAETRYQITNLPAVLFAREYAFEVKAGNADGVWTDDTIQHAFTVNPAWYASWWFVLFVLVGLGTAVHLVYRDRIRRERLRHEIDSARSIQRKLQPAHPLQTDRYEIAGACVPAFEVGGDHFDYRTLDSGRRVVIILVDVEGKRMEGAFHAAVVRGMISSIFDDADASDLPTTATRLNQMIYDALGGETAVSALLAVFDVSESILHVVNAGCEPPIVVGDDGNDGAPPGRSLPPLGKVRSAEFDASAIPVRDTDTVVFVSDGITEAMKGGWTSNRRRIAAVVELHRRESATEIIRHVLEVVASGTGRGLGDDDRTVVVLRRRNR